MCQRQTYTRLCSRCLRRGCASVLATTSLPCTCRMPSKVIDAEVEFPHAPTGMARGKADMDMDMTRNPNWVKGELRAA